MPGAFGAREILRLATRGRADVLGRDDIGYLAPGMAADFIGVRIDTLAMAGAAVHDPLAAVVFTQPATVDLNVIASGARCWRSARKRGRGIARSRAQPHRWSLARGLRNRPV